MNTPVEIVEDSININGVDGIPNKVVKKLQVDYGDGFKLYETIYCGGTLPYLTLEYRSLVGFPRVGMSRSIFKEEYIHFSLEDIIELHKDFMIKEIRAYHYKL